ncbi:MAG: SDR family oxidoreductase [Deltaproteobacteria bacterium]|nr:SDR family oxidoreductase [Deltaproteobacteria bacterium]MBW2418755.1 SDR family oxidoreductase [Deltaproteobacteria bacterium]
MTELAGRRVLVVGASSGIGRSIARVLATEGVRVAAAARRFDRLRELVEEAGPGVEAIACDVRDPASCAYVVARSVELLGGLDALVYAAGIALLMGLDDADDEAWRESLEVNVVGPSLITRAALPHLEASRGRVIFLSSIAAQDHPPRRGLGLYVTAKAAMNMLVSAWQVEQRAVSFTRVNVGDTGSTEMACEWDPAAGGYYVREWMDRGLLFGRSMLPESVARHVVTLLASDEAVPESTITPRFPNE